MPIDVFANFAQTTLAAAVTTTPAAGTSETWAVASTAVFPQIGTAGVEQFRLTVGQPTDPSPEIVICTGIPAAGQITVSRGAEGSTIKTHLLGDPVYQTVTVGSLDTFRFMTQTITSSQNVTAPAWATVADVTLIGGGGGGGGAGSALTSGGVTNQSGANGGDGGGYNVATIGVTPSHSYAVVIGAEGAGGAGGPVNGNAGTSGGDGGASQFNDDVHSFVYQAYGGRGGFNSGANTSNFPPQQNEPYQTAALPSNGGQAQAAWAPQPQMGIGGGAGGDSATSTTGGYGGGAGNGQKQNPPSSSTPSTANGANGLTATVFGCGGGGGGGGAPGGGGGGGGNGAPGVCIIEWRSQ